MRVQPIIVGYQDERGSWYVRGLSDVVQVQHKISFEIEYKSNFDIQQHVEQQVFSAFNKRYSAEDGYEIIHKAWTVNQDKYVSTFRIVWARNYKFVPSGATEAERLKILATWFKESTEPLNAEWGAEPVDDELIALAQHLEQGTLSTERFVAAILKRIAADPRNRPFFIKNIQMVYLNISLGLDRYN